MASYYCMIWMKYNLFNFSTINGHLYPSEFFPSSCDSWAPIVLLMSGFTTLQYKWPHFSLSEFVNVLSTTAPGWTCEFCRFHMHRPWQCKSSDGSCCLSHRFRRNFPFPVSFPEPHFLLSATEKSPAQFLRRLLVRVHPVFWPTSHIQLQMESQLILHLGLDISLSHVASWLYKWVVVVLHVLIYVCVRTPEVNTGCLSQPLSIFSF